MWFQWRRANQKTCWSAPYRKRSSSNSALTSSNRGQTKRSKRVRASSMGTGVQGKWLMVHITRPKIQMGDQTTTTTTTRSRTMRTTSRMNSAFTLTQKWSTVRHKSSSSKSCSSSRYCSLSRRLNCSPASSASASSDRSDASHQHTCSFNPY